MYRFVFVVFFVGTVSCGTGDRLGNEGTVKNVAVLGLKSRMGTAILDMMSRGHHRLESLFRKISIRAGVGGNRELIKGGEFTSSLTGTFYRSRSGTVSGAYPKTFGKFSAHSDLGSGLKYDVNQDGFAIFGNKKSLSLVTIDGISTGGSGEIATEVVINSLRDSLPKKLSLSEALLSTQNSLKEYALANPQVSQKYGVVAVGAEIRGNLALVSHVGDARLLHIRDGRIAFQTTDHNPTYEKVVRGSMAPEEYVQDNVDKSLVDKALRIPENGVIDEKIVETTFRHLDSGDTLLLASDAVWNLFTNKEIAAFTKGRTSEEIISHIRVQVARRVGNLKKRDDNFTMIVYQHDPNKLL